LPEAVPVPALERWFPRFVVVLEGAAAAGAAGGQADSQVRIVRARGSGDDEIVRQAAEAAQAAGPHLVVTADRELRARCTSAGASVIGPRWLLDLL